MRLRIFALVAAALLLAGCERAPVSVGSKDTVQDRILGEMMARMLEAQGHPVERRTGLGDSAEAFQALRGGRIDVYPEYTGTALALLGAPAEPDRAATRARLAGPFAELGLRFLEPFGFESRYVLVTRRNLSRSAGISSVEDLARRAGRLRLGVSRSFAERPHDGLAPFLARFGLDFAEVTILPAPRRMELYGLLVEERIDVMVGFSTDPQIADFGLVALEPHGPFFPAYEAAPLISDAALARHPGLDKALAPLAGRIDAAMLRDMVRQVQVGGKTPRAVAAIALGRLGLIDAGAPPPETPLAIAIEAQEVGARPANLALEAVRTAMPGRAVSLLTAADPLAALAAREARLAVVPAAAHFGVGPEGVVRDETVEAVGVAGRAIVYALAYEDGPRRLGGARTVATGPEGSPSHTIGAVLARHGPEGLRLAPQAEDGAAALGAALAAGEADAALVVASRQRPDLVELLRRDARLRLVDAAGWWQGPVRLALPFLGETTLRPETHPGLEAPVTVLSMQTVLTGPAPADDRLLGRQGPSAFDTKAAPLADATVLALDAALGLQPDVGPNLRAATALSPRPRETPSVRNPRPDQAALSAGIFAYLAFAIWLLLRPRRSG